MSKNGENDLDWTQTLEIKYDSNKKNQINKNSKKSNDNILNDFILSLDANPFDQPSMNTIEFNSNEIWNNNHQEIKSDKKEKALFELDKLFNEKKISIDEYFEEKQKIINN